MRVFVPRWTQRRSAAAFSVWIRYRDVQRLSVKRAIGMMIDNSDLQSRFVSASSYADLSQLQTATEYGNTAVESLVQSAALKAAEHRCPTWAPGRRGPSRPCPRLLAPSLPSPVLDRGCSSSCRSPPLSPPSPPPRPPRVAFRAQIQILEYFPDKLSATSLSPEQRNFVLAALSSCSKNIDAFLSLMPEMEVPSRADGHNGARFAQALRVSSPKRGGVPSQGGGACLGGTLCRLRSCLDDTSTHSHPTRIQTYTPQPLCVFPNS